MINFILFEKLSLKNAKEVLKYNIHEISILVKKRKKINEKTLRNTKNVLYLQK
jgi:hypothetical protein